MGKTTNLFKKIEDNKGAFHARMDMIKDRNSKKQTEAEEIKKRWQDYIEEVQTAVKRREAKGKGEQERHTHLNAEF